MKRYFIVMNRVKARLAVFDTIEVADAATKTLVTFRNVTECRVVEEHFLQDFVQEVYGDEYYGVYDVYDATWYVHERAPYDTAACDWCSLGGRFCEECNRTGEDPFEQCGEQVDMLAFCEWLDKGGVQ